MRRHDHSLSLCLSLYLSRLHALRLISLISVFLPSTTARLAVAAQDARRPDQDGRVGSKLMIFFRAELTPVHAGFSSPHESARCACSPLHRPALTVSTRTHAHYTHARTPHAHCTHAHTHTTHPPLTHAISALLPPKHRRV
jgi:hypothetical protein